MKKTFFWGLLFLGCVSTLHSNAMVQADSVYIVLSLENPETKIVHVTMKWPVHRLSVTYFKMPQWTPGYYQIMNYAKNVSSFFASGNQNQPLSSSKTNDNTWAVNSDSQDSIILHYDVLADNPFVAASFLDTSHAYLTPAATFLYMDNTLGEPVSLCIQSYHKWSRIATGLDSVGGNPYSYTARNFDLLYDCPILAGNLEELPSFSVRGIQHRFIGYKLGNFDKVALMNDLKHIVEASVNMIKDIPYNQYTFLGIGPGNGGIEHLNSSANSFSGNALNTSNGRKSMMSFLAHEYFHNYNVKRIRPIELGPFDYDQGSRTKQLWISEGWTVYYEYLLTHRAGITTTEDAFKALTKNILAYETHTGRQAQSLAKASEETWSDGPFGNDPSKTISYYDKGPVVALMLDFTIRHFTGNTRSLDDVVRRLYNEFYKKKSRGFTETELRKVCEETARHPLDEIFGYIYSTTELDYKKYFNYGGLDIDVSGRTFVIRSLENADSLQKAILSSWLRGDTTP